MGFWWYSGVGSVQTRLGGASRQCSTSLRPHFPLSLKRVALTPGWRISHSHPNGNDVLVQQTSPTAPRRVILKPVIFPHFPEFPPGPQLSRPEQGRTKQQHTFPGSSPCLHPLLVPTPSAPSELECHPNTPICFSGNPLRVVKEMTCPLTVHQKAEAGEWPLRAVVRHRENQAEAGGLVSMQTGFPRLRGKPSHFGK